MPFSDTVPLNLKSRFSFSAHGEQNISDSFFDILIYLFKYSNRWYSTTVSIRP